MTTLMQFSVEPTLVGHICPLCQYPSRVIPILASGRALYAAFINGDEASVQLLPADAEFVRHEREGHAESTQFEYREESLFALAKDRLFTYHISERREFYTYLLSDASFCATQPFVRLSLAKEVFATDQVLNELQACVARLSPQSPQWASAWYSFERGRILEMFAAQGIEAKLPQNIFEMSAGTLGSQTTAMVTSDAFWPGAHDLVKWHERSDKEPPRLRETVKYRAHSVLQYVAGRLELIVGDVARRSSSDADLFWQKSFSLAHAFAQEDRDTDSARLADLFWRHSLSLAHAFARENVKRQRVDDVVGEAMKQLVMSLRKGVPVPLDLRELVFAHCRHAILQLISATRANSRYSTSEGAMELAESIVDRNSGPLDSAILRERSLLVDSSMEALDIQQKQVLQGLYYENSSVSEIAQSMRVSETVVRETREAALEELMLGIVAASKGTRLDHALLERVGMSYQPS